LFCWSLKLESRQRTSHAIPVVTQTSLLSIVKAQGSPPRPTVHSSAAATQPFSLRMERPLHCNCNPPLPPVFTANQAPNPRVSKGPQPPRFPPRILSLRFCRPQHHLKVLRGPQAPNERTKRPFLPTDHPFFIPHPPRSITERALPRRRRSLARTARMKGPAES
jgi:hypothetical protein